MNDQSASGNCKAEPKQLTESEKILDAFDIKIEALDRSANIIITKVTSFGGFEYCPVGEPPCDAQKPPQGGSFIGELQIRLEKLQRLIEAYEAIRYNLEKLV